MASVPDAAAAGLRYWQICPIGPTGFGDSPYQLFSGRAGNPYGQRAAVTEDAYQAWSETH